MAEQAGVKQATPAQPNAGGATGPAMSDLQVEFSEDVEKAIAEVFPDQDPLESADFDVVAYINSQFPNEQSLAGLDDYMSKLKGKMRRLDNDIYMSVRQQTTAKRDSQHALQDVQAGMTELFTRVRDIKEKAAYSEEMVQEITRDIKSLDFAKRHLTTSITTLNHLHMLVGGVDSLDAMTKNRQYRDAANLLGAVINVTDHFKDHTDIQRIKDLSKSIERIKRNLASQITMEFKTVFIGPIPDQSSHNTRQLSDSCAVVDVLDPSVKDEIISWFVQLQMRDYLKTFTPDKEASWVDKIDRRYAWFKRTLASFNENCTGIFPDEWKMPENLAIEFCRQTSEDLRSILLSRKAELHVKLLLHALQRTMGFEQLLAGRFKEDDEDFDDDEEDEDDRKIAELEAKATTEADSIRLKYLKHRLEKERAARGEDPNRRRKRREPKPSKFTGSISNVFECCMDIYVNAQDVSLREMMGNFVEELKGNGGLGNPDDDSEEAKVLPSCADMFIFFKNCMVQCAQFSTKEALFNLYKVFKKYLQEYATAVLLAHLPRGSALQSLLLKDGEIRLTMQEQYLVCSILNTAEYSLETTKQLEEKLREKVDAPFSEEVDLNEEQDLFHEVISTSIALLVRGLESQCEPALVAMTKMRWDTIDEVGDTSSYVSQIGKHIAQTVPFVRSNLASSRKYFTNFCLKFANAFIPRVVSYMHKCKHVSPTGADQLLLDMQSMKTIFLSLPTIGSVTQRKGNQGYTRFVQKGMLKAEMMLKVLRKPHDPPKLYVEDYLELVGGDDGIPAFQKLLEMKGLSKKEQSPLLETFRSLAPASANETDLSGKESLKAPGSPTAGKRSSIRKLERLMKRFQ